VTLAAALAALATFAAAPPARGDREVTPADVARARLADELLAEGRTRMAAEDYASAVIVLDAAEVLDAGYASALEAARAHEQLGHAGRAAQLYARAASRAPTDEERRAAEERRDALAVQDDARDEAVEAIEPPSLSHDALPPPREPPSSTDSASGADEPPPSGRSTPSTVPAGAGARPVLVASRLSAAPRVDGALDDEAWRAVPAVSDFRVHLPANGTPPAERTTIRVGYTPDALYVAFDCASEHTPVVARVTPRDAVADVDAVAISLDAGRTRRRAVELVVSAAGVQEDRLRFNDDAVTSDWNDVWSSAVHRRRDGWSAEIRVPMRVLRPDADAPIVGFQARRMLAARREIVEWAPVRRDQVGEVSRYGDLVGLSGVSSGSGLDARPFLLGRATRTDARSDLVDSGLTGEASVGADLRWRLGRETQLTAALNPDFGQLPADAAVLNLSTYELRLPERRPFFLEGLDAFNTPVELVFTRRIGAVPPPVGVVAPSEAGARLVSPLTPAATYGALKLAGAAGQSATYGALVAATGPVQGVVERPDGTRSLRLAQPLAVSAASRMKVRLGPDVSVGLLATSVVRLETLDDPFRLLNPTRADLPFGSYLPVGGGVACPGGGVVPAGARCFHDAHVLSADTRWHIGGGDWVLVAQALASVLPGGPPVTYRDGTVRASGDVGAATWVNLTKSGGEHWVGSVSHWLATPRVDYGDLGFMYRQNDQSGTARVEYRTLAPFGYARETHTSLRVREQTNVDGLLLGADVGVATSWTFLSGWTLDVGDTLYGGRFDDREVGDGTALQRAWNDEAWVSVSTNPSARVVLGAYAAAAFRENGEAGVADANVMVRPVPSVELRATPSLYATRGEPRFGGRDADGVLRFGRQSAEAASLTLRSSVFFGPRVTLQGYAQLFASRLAYTETLTPGGLARGPGGRALVRLDDLIPYTGSAPLERSGSISFNANVVLTWEYALGSRVVVAYARGQGLAPGDASRGLLDLRALGRGPAVDTLLVKVDRFFD